MQMEMNRPATAGRRPLARAQALRAQADRAQGTLSRRELRRIVAEMVD